MSDEAEFDDDKDASEGDDEPTNTKHKVGKRNVVTLESSSDDEHHGDNKRADIALAKKETPRSGRSVPTSLVRPSPLHV
jgi:hypothetical protein